MRVLCVIPSVSPKDGGPSFALSFIVRALVEKGLSIDVATTDEGKGRDRAKAGHAIEREGVRYFSFPRQTNFYKTSWSFRSWIRKNAGEYDLIHIHALFSFTSIVAAHAARHQGVPYIVRPLGVLNRWGMRNRRRFLKRLSFRFVETPILRDAAAIHYTSEQERKEAQSIGVRTRSFVIPIGVDFEHVREPEARAAFLQNWPDLADRDIVLFLSRVDRKKGLDLLLDAFATVVRQRPNARLLVAGNGDQSYIDELRGMASVSGITDNVVWSGFLEGRQKSGAFAAARVFVLPSYSENFGIAAVEALSSGVPSVITEGVAVATEMQQAGAAVVVPPRPAELATAILRVLDDKDLSRQLAFKGQAFAKENYSIEHMGQSLVAMYEAICRSE